MATITKLEQQFKEGKPSGYKVELSDGTKGYLVEKDSDKGLQQGDNVTFTSVNTANQGLAAYDDGLGAFTGDAVGTINYITGVYSLTFTSAPKSGVTVYAQIVPYTPAIPDTILFYQDEFWVRPVPDQPYCIEIEVSIRPTELLSGTEMPDLTQWWQYIAIGAARKILIDRLDFETANMLEAEFNDQESKILYRTVIQNSSRR